MRTALFRICVATALLAAGFVAGRLTPEPVVQASVQDEKVFEMRTYTTNEGRLPALQTRFRDHTLGFFKKYDMTSIGYWVPTDGPTAQTTLVYIRVAQGRAGVAGRWHHPGQSAGIGVSQSHGLLADQVAHAMSA